MDKQDMIEVALAATEPLIEEIGDVADRVSSLESGVTRQAANNACAALVAMADAMTKDSMSVSALPHIHQRLQVLQAYGKDAAFAMPEVHS